MLGDTEFEIWETANTMNFIEFLAIWHCYSWLRTSTYQRGLLPKITTPKKRAGGGGGVAGGGLCGWCQRHRDGKHVGKEYLNIMASVLLNQNNSNNIRK